MNAQVSSLPAGWKRLPGALKATGLAVLGAALGAAISLAPSAVIAFLVALLLAGVVALAPVRFFAAALLAGMVAAPSLILAPGTLGSSALGVLAGQARVIGLTVALIVLRVGLTRREGQRQALVPPVLPTVVVAWLALVLYTVLVAAASGTSYSGELSDVSRDLAYPFAAVVGFLAAAEASQRGRLISLYRALGAVAFVAAVLSIVYWAWTTGHLAVGGRLGALFEQVRTASLYPTSRSIFPFVQDSPNLGAVAFVALAALVLPPLLRLGGRRDRALALVLALVTVGAVLTTQSRTGVIALVAAPWPFAFIAARRGVGAGRRLRTLGLAVVAAATVLVAAVSLFPASRALSSNADTLQAREQIWRQALSAVGEQPAIGHGYRYSYNGHFVELSSAAGAASSRAVSTHSELLSQLVDGGLLGFIAFTTVMTAMVGVARRALRNPHSRATGVGHLCFMAALLTAGLDSTTSQSAIIVVITWLALGLTCGVAAGWRRDRAAEM